MKRSVNTLRNPDFQKGKASPRGWVWESTAPGAYWRRYPSSPGISITSDAVEGTSRLSQTVVCKPGEWYRVEATVTADLVAGDESGGLFLGLQPLKDGLPEGISLATPGVHGASEPIALRAYYQAPVDVRRLKFSVGLVNAKGTAAIHQARFIRIIEPEEEAHLLAIPPPRSSLRSPREVKHVCICAGNAATRRISTLLAKCLGDRNASMLSPAEFRPDKLEADALLLPDEKPPAGLRSLATLMKLAADRIVIISLPAFARLTRGKLVVRRIEQEDDPIHARVVHASYATHGFALRDTFPYAWGGRRAGSFVQQQFRKTVELSRFCRKHGLAPMLHSMCDRDVTSDRPICLHKMTSHGGLFVLDIEPAEEAGSTLGEPNLAMHLLLSILGHAHVGLGQYAVPHRDEGEFRGLIRETAERFPHFVVHDADVPVDEVTEQLVTIGRDDQSFGLPLKPKPLILVRSGLSAGDVESVYGAFLWFKQLVRTQPYPCPYANELISQFRLAWVPCMATWESHRGWQRSCAPPLRPMTLELEDAEIAAMIDIVARPINRVRIVLDGDAAAYSHYSTWLPRLSRTFPPGRYFSKNVAAGDGFMHRDGFAWRHGEQDVEVVVDSAAFADDIHREAIEAGGRIIRTEVPGWDADFSAQSIQRTDLTATLLEQVIGLQYGLIAVNRGTAAAQLDGYPPVAAGAALIVDRSQLLPQAENPSPLEGRGRVRGESTGFYHGSSRVGRVPRPDSA